MSTTQDTTMLGKTGIQITSIGTGTWQWGDTMLWGFGRGYQEADVREAFEVSLQLGINFFDTAEMYGSGRSERLLGSFLPLAQAPLVVASKFMPYPWRLTKKTLLNALQSSLKRLNLERIDLYQMHWPFPPVPIETWSEALADAIGQGLVRAVGVSNYDEAQMRRSYSTLAKRGVPLASNQVHYSLLNRKVEFNGLLKACQELGITLIAYSPLEKGVLTGKYTPDKPMPGLRGRNYNRAYLEKAGPLVQILRETGRQHGGKTPSQVALNWLICKGAVPIPGAKNPRQAQDNGGALGWRLSEAEIAALDEASARAIGAKE